MKDDGARMGKKGQTWYIDYVASIVLFIIGLYLIISFLPSNNDNDIVMESNIISDILMSEGMPEYWNLSNIISPGISSNGWLNATKVDFLKSMNYTTLKSYFPVSSDFYVYFEYQNKSPVNVTSFGKNVTGYDNVIIKKRILLYNGRLVIMNVMVGKN